MGQQGITKKQSAMLQGLAILMMLYHHFFMTPHAYGDDFIFLRINMVERISWFCKICVGTFAFVSGYGMCRVLSALHKEQQDASFWSLLLQEYKLVFRQIIRLWIRFWIILLLFMGIVFARSIKPFDRTEFLQNFFCISTSYNGADWYVEQYSKMMLVLPLMHLFFLKFTEEQKKKQRAVFYGILLGILAMLYLTGKFFSPQLHDLISRGINFFRPDFLLCFIVGYLLSRFTVYEKIENGLSRLPLLRLPIALLCLIAVGLIRLTLAYTAAYAGCDYLLVPFFVYGFLTFTGYIKILGNFFAWVGRYSTYMWLIHVYLYDFTSHFFRAHLSSHLVFYCVQVLLSLAVSVLLTEADHVVTKRFRKSEKNTGKT